MYKVFIENKPVIFSIKEDNIARVAITTDSPEEIIKFIVNIRDVKFPEIRIACSNPQLMWQSVFKDYKKIKAAGGVVLKDDSLLLIHRLGCWDLPKGKVEKGEKNESAALREVEEECGIHGHNIVAFVGETYHTYQMNGKNYLKSTDWFLMRYEGEETLTAQKEEHISEVKWVPVSIIHDYRMKMYPSLLPVLDSALDLIKSGTLFAKK